MKTTLFFFILVIVIILIFIALLYGYFKYGLFTDYNSIRAKRDIKRGNVRILILGESNHNERFENTVARDFGFQYKKVAGNVVDQVLKNGVEQYNKVVAEYMLQTHGTNWEAEFKEKLARKSEQVKKNDKFPTQSQQ